jgi:hypothetical protein
MDLYSNILYVGGEFTTIGAAASPVSRAYATAFDTTTGLSTSWAPELNNVVNKVIASSNKVYLAGKFTSANASAYQRNYLAATNLTTGAVDTSWNPNCNAEVLTLALGANSLYAGGKFTQCNSSVTRNYLASFNLTTGSLESNWNPNPNNVVNSIALGNNSLYAGGKFTTVNGTKNKSYLASFNLTDATVTAWAPTVNNYVEAIAYSDDGVYAIGAFTYANNKTRAYSAKFEINQGLLDGTWQAYPEFNPDLGGYPNSRKMLYLSHESVYVGGNFMSAGAEGGAGYLAPLDYVTGNWYPGFSE